MLTFLKKVQFNNVAGNTFNKYTISTQKFIHKMSNSDKQRTNNARVV